MVGVSFFIIIEQELGFTSLKESTVYEYCKGNKELETCVLENSSRYSNYVNLLNRNSLTNPNKVKVDEDDRGGCDLVALKKLASKSSKSFFYSLSEKELLVRSWIVTCSDDASRSLYISFNGKAHPTDRDIPPDPKELDETFDETFAFATDFFSSPENQLRRGDFGKVALVTSFDILPFLLAIAPLLLMIYAAYLFRIHIFPLKNENISEWLSSQKKFRIALVLTLIWFSIFLISITTTSGYGRLLQTTGAAVLILFAQFYPLLLILITKYITSSEN